MTTFNIKFLLICLSAYVFSAVFCSSNEPIYGKDPNSKPQLILKPLGLKRIYSSLIVVHFFSVVPT